MGLCLPPSWEKPLGKYLHSQAFEALSVFVHHTYSNETCYPPQEALFNAFACCPFDEVKVVILGQDPYHGEGQAHGLSFSVPKGIALPPSLKNILKEWEENTGFPQPPHGDLSPWAKRGVLLLNSILSVEAHRAGSHQRKGWEELTDTVIETLSIEREGLVFMLWGGFAQKKAFLIDEGKHLVLRSGHPSPLSANRGYWFGNKHFSRCNSYLIEKGKTPMDWSL